MMPIIRIGRNALPEDCEISKRGLSRAMGDGKEHLALSLIRYYKSGIVAEIGVEAGGLVARICSQLGGFVDEYVCVDPWVVYEEWADRPLWDREKKQEYWETKYLKVVELAKRFPQMRIVRKTSVEAAKEFPNGHFDFIYLDAVHDFPNIINDLWAWLPKMKDDGVVSGHDYMKRFVGYIRAIDYVFREDFHVPGPQSHWYAVLTGEKKRIYLDRISEKFPDPPSILKPENKQMYYRERLDYQ